MFQSHMTQSCKRDLDFQPWYKSYKTINIRRLIWIVLAAAERMALGGSNNIAKNSGNLHSFQITRSIHMAPAKGAPAGADPKGSSMFLYR